MKLPWFKWQHILSPTKDGLGEIKRRLAFTWKDIETKKKCQRRTTQWCKWRKIESKNPCSTILNLKTGEIIPIPKGKVSDR